MLLYMEDYSYEEIAENVGMSSSNIGLRFTGLKPNYKNILTVISMEANDIKNIWKSGIEGDIDRYSDSELNKMVVKSARKSIKAVYPGTIFRLIIIGVIMYLIAILLWSNRSKEVIFLDFSGLIILSVSYFLWERSAYKMRKYTYGMPVKEWLEYRIKQIEKSIKFNKKYDLLIYGCSFLFATGFYAFYQVATKMTPGLLNLFIIPIGLVIYLWIVRCSLNRNYRKTLNELKELYTQFEESNE